MKKILLVLLITSLYISISAQNLDKLTLSNDRVIMCTVKQISKDVIYYKIEDERGQIDNYSIPFDDVLVLETDNKFISEKFMEIKVDKSIPARIEMQKSTLFFVGGAILGISGITLWSWAESSKNPPRNHGQISTAGIALTTAGVGLAVLGILKLKKAGDKLTDKTYYFGPTNEGLGFVYTF
ncbi:MAG: hypothetical protein ISR55_06935 [Bacteroidetes bacterium]|nr:hypothetical protein [Bacteroidota bacterium]